MIDAKQKEIIKNSKEHNNMHSFYDAYEENKINVRNVMAHISYKGELFSTNEDAAEGDERPYLLERETRNKKEEKTLTDILMEEIENVNEGKEHSVGIYFRDCLKNEDGEIERKKHLLKELLDDFEQRNGTRRQVPNRNMQENQQPICSDFDRKLQKLRIQLGIMKDSESFHAFYAKKGDCAMLFHILDSWIAADKQGVQPMEADYRKYFEAKKTKGGNKEGYERVVDSLT